MPPAKLPLYKQGIITGYILIDQELFEYLSQWTWRENHNGYVSRVEKHPDGRPKHQRTVIMHRTITNTPSDMVVDHINGDKLDNRKQNLRICTVGENNRNVNVCRNPLGYKGVKRRKITKMESYNARIHVGNKRLHLGTFRTPEQAAIAYNEAAVKYYGEFAALNKVNI